MTDPSPTPRILALDPSRRTTFRDLWVPWLKAMTGQDPEPEDLAAVSDPGQFYVAAGGAVFFALLGDQPVGVVAVKRLSQTEYEFCKLVVLDQARGHGLGKALVQACIEFAREAGGEVLYLQSFRKLDVALHMYETMGFQSMPAPPRMLVLKRTEIIMGLSLQNWL